MFFGVCLYQIKRWALSRSVKSIQVLVSAQIHVFHYIYTPEIVMASISVLNPMCAPFCARCSLAEVMLAFWIRDGPSCNEPSH